MSIPTMQKLHSVQSFILVELLYKAQAKFSELNKTDLENSEFTYHINQLIKYKLIEKTENKKYKLTEEGIFLASKIDLEQTALAKIPKSGLCLYITRELKNDTEILLAQKKRNPNMGRILLPGRKIVQGMTLMEISDKYLTEEIGLLGNIEYKGVISFRSNEIENGLDRIMHVFTVNNAIGDIKKNSKDAKFSWYQISKLSDNTQKIDFLDMQLQMIMSAKGTLYGEINLDMLRIAL